ncbi:MAG: hypothetical protein JO256_01155 [Alphaproteobacteria bacterium]|nr:hypothetical protein [Alphaproteobacteria bacterium]
MKLVVEWKSAWRWFSVQAMVLTAAVQAAWAALPDDLKSHVPGRIVTALSLLLLVLGICGRLVQQDR